MPKPRVLNFWVLLIGVLGWHSRAAADCCLCKRPPCLTGFAGQVLDFTNNHGDDRRLWSNALQEKRDLYVYLPPGFDPRKKYPFIFWFHGISQDEKGMIDAGLPQIDAAMVQGRLTPAIIAMPDGSLRGRPGCFSPHSAFLNTRAGRFEDFLFEDVYEFLQRSFPLRPERGAHVLTGVSLGGAAAYHHAIVRRAQFGVVMGIFPPLNLRWLDCHGRYFGNFDPDCWGWREHYFLGCKPVGKFCHGLVCVPFRRLAHPLYGSGKQVVAQMSRDNPIEMLDVYDLKKGELDMLVAYVRKDEFNVDAQVESFLHRAREKDLPIEVLYNPNGRHDEASALSFVPAMIDWLQVRLQPYHPDRK